jgi:diacylglycerol kinase family enzyme
MSKKSKTLRVKLIVNPDAGKASDSASNLKLVTGYLEQNGVKTDVTLANKKDKITQLAQRAVKKGFKIVVAVGGDGTTKAVMRGIIGSKVRLGIIPLGIDNFIANRLGIPKDLEEACALIASHRALKVDIGQAKTNDGHKSVFFDMVTLGLSKAIYPDSNKATKKIISVKNNGDMAPAQQDSTPQATLTLDNEPRMDVETRVVMARFTPGTAENNPEVPEDSIQGGCLDITVFPGFSKTEILRYFTEESDHAYSGKQKIQNYQARKLIIKTSPKLDVMTDGIAFGRGSVSIKVLSEALRVITDGTNLVMENPQNVLAEPQPEEKAKPASHVEKTNPAEEELSMSDGHQP